MNCLCGSVGGLTGHIFRCAHGGVNFFSYLADCLFCGFLHLVEGGFHLLIHIGIFIAVFYTFHSIIDLGGDVFKFFGIFDLGNRFVHFGRKGFIFFRRFNLLYGILHFFGHIIEEGVSLFLCFFQIKGYIRTAVSLFVGSMFL